MPRRALVAGTSGLIGSRIAGRLAERGWQVTGLSRRAKPYLPWRQIAVDLTDGADARAKLAEFSDITHVFYAARFDHPEGALESESINAAMLCNLIEALAPAAPQLTHVNLVHGTKYYGHHLGPIPLPAVEDGPRGRGATYYFAQEDLIRAEAARCGWSWSIARPHTFCGAPGEHPRSIGLVIAVLAALQRELGEPLYFPGSTASYAARTQFTELALLARAVEWMATEPRCANEAFNIVNDDAPRWSELWPRLAGLLEVEPGLPRPVRLARYVADKAAVWNGIVARHGLQRRPLADIVLWDYGDYVFQPEWDIISSMDKARRCGFSDSVDSTEMFARMFAEYRAQRLIP